MSDFDSELVLDIIFDTITRSTRDVAADSIADANVDLIADADIDKIASVIAHAMVTNVFSVGTSTAGVNILADMDNTTLTKISNTMLDSLYNIDLDNVNSGIYENAGIIADVIVDAIDEILR